MNGSPTTTPAQVRALFPALARSSYLNAAAASPLAVPVEHAAVLQLRDTLEWGDLGFPTWLQRREEIRTQFAGLIGARTDEVAFLPSTSMGFHVVGDLLRQLGVREVVSLADEFPSSLLPLLNQGFTVRLVRPHPDGTVPVSEVEQALRRATGAVVVSAVQYASGFRIDLDALSRMCRQRQVLLAVNGAQALGQIPLDVARTRIDFLCGTSHKWMMGGFGVGLFFARRKWLRQLHLPFAGWQSILRPMKMDNRSGSRIKVERGGRVLVARGARFRKDAAALEAGNTSYAALFSFGAALDLLEGVGIQQIASHNHRLQSGLRQELRRRGFSPACPDAPELTAGICVFAVKGSPSAVAGALGKRGVMVSPRGAGIRVSTHVFNAEEDLDQLFWAMEKLKVRPP